MELETIEYKSNRYLIKKRTRIILNTFLIISIFATLYYEIYFLTILFAITLISDMIVFYNYKNNKYEKVILTNESITHYNYGILKLKSKTIKWDEVIDIECGYKFTTIRSNKELIMISGDEYDEYSKIKQFLNSMEKKLHEKRNA